MTPIKFLQKNVTGANAIARKYGIPPLVTLAMAALESGYGEKAPGYNYFGYTASKSYTGKKNLVTTTEYHTTPNVDYPKVLKVTKISSNKYKYRVQRYFKAYNNPTESFLDYGSLIYNADRYDTAFDFKSDPKKFFAEIFKAGYATSPSYYNLVISVMNSMQKLLV